MSTQQERNLTLLGRLALLLPFVLTAVAVLLYLGHELPPHDLRRYFTTASGYATPPNPQVVVPGTVPRKALRVAGSALQVEDGGPAPRVTDVGRPNAQRATGNPQHERSDSGASLYRINCAMCHGEPGTGPGPVAELYIPRPPDLLESIAKLSPERLYAIITDGIRSAPTPEAARYLPDEWHAFRPLMRESERWAVVNYLKGGSRLRNSLPLTENREPGTENREPPSGGMRP